jgi:hypothetical protein
MYSLENVIRSVHVIPTSAEHESFYVNNYIDWDHYNTLYDPDFLRNGNLKRLAKQLARQLDTEMKLINSIRNLQIEVIYDQFAG